MAIDNTSDRSGAATHSPLRTQVQRGSIVAVALAVLTIGEYWVAVAIDDPLIWLIPFAVAKGALIMEYFMHFSSLLSGGDH
jgi:hypothetical protein